MKRAREAVTLMLSCAEVYQVNNLGGLAIQEIVTPSLFLKRKRGNYGTWGYVHKAKNRYERYGTGYGNGDDGYDHTLDMRDKTRSNALEIQ